MSPLPPSLFKTWVHSHEEDTSEYRVYRPSTYAFPPSRGRSGFELRPDGSFVRIDIAPTDGSRAVEGRWEAVAPDQVQVSIPGSGTPPTTIAILSHDEETLRVRR